MTDAAEPDTPVARLVRERIAREGPVPFADVMRLALYHPDHGYYARGPTIGPGGDFSTSVSFPSFRRAMARLVRHARAALAPGGPFRVVELGAGTGQLARSILEEVPDIEYVTVDASPALRSRQAAIPGVRAVASTRDLAPAAGLVFGNEVLDALPVHRVIGTEDGLLEVHVDVQPGRARLRERLRPLSDARVAARLDSLGIRLARGQMAEVALDLPEFVHDAARLVDRGFLLFIDYGDPAPALYRQDRPNGTLTAYKAGGRFHDPLARLGEQDLTADVDFTTVARAAADAGLEELGLATQQEFLDGLGIAELGMPDEVRLVAGAAGLGTAFHVAAFRRGTDATLPGF